jgi:hypothetical protein
MPILLPEDLEMRAMIKEIARSGQSCHEDEL